jgi:hypothetical protein
LQVQAANGNATAAAAIAQLVTISGTGGAHNQQAQLNQTMAARARHLQAQNRFS